VAVEVAGEIHNVSLKYYSGASNFGQTTYVPASLPANLPGIEGIFAESHTCIVYLLFLFTVTPAAFVPATSTGIQVNQSSQSPFSNLPSVSHLPRIFLFQEHQTVIFLSIIPCTPFQISSLPAILKRPIGELYIFANPPSLSQILEG
jgi:hypothetical protein